MFISTFVYIDLIGYLPGAVAYRQARGGTFGMASMYSTATPAGCVTSAFTGVSLGERYPPGLAALAGWMFWLMWKMLPGS